MDRLRQVYRPKLQDQLEELLADLREASTATPVRPLWTRAHNMKGTSGSYGFRAVSDQLQQAENQLRPFREDTAPQIAIDTAVEAVALALSSLE